MLLGGFKHGTSRLVAWVQANGTPVSSPRAVHPVRYRKRPDGDHLLTCVMVRGPAPNHIVEWLEHSRVNVGASRMVIYVQTPHPELVQLLDPYVKEGYLIIHELNDSMYNAGKGLGPQIWPMGYIGLQYFTQNDCYYRYMDASHGIFIGDPDEFILTRPETGRFSDYFASNLPQLRDNKIASMKLSEIVFNRFTSCACPADTPFLMSNYRVLMPPRHDYSSYGMSFTYQGYQFDKDFYMTHQGDKVFPTSEYEEIVAQEIERRRLPPSSSGSDASVNPINRSDQSVNQIHQSENGLKRVQSYHMNHDNSKGKPVIVSGNASVICNHFVCVAKGQREILVQPYVAYESSPSTLPNFFFFITLT